MRDVDIARPRNAADRICAGKMQAADAIISRFLRSNRNLNVDRGGHTEAENSVHQPARLEEISSGMSSARTPPTHAQHIS